ncbi:MAG: glycosyltransferase family 9 protein [Planctomycetales bacterium]|nr:glycosyltransferase family 9 protein [Planctomycetales bacterium]
MSAIGDAIMTMPLACALREHYPNAFITWIAEPGAGAVLKGHASIDELVVLPKRWLKSPRTVWQLRERLHALQIEVAIDPQSLSKSAIAAWLTGARRRIGFKSPRGRELSLALNNVRHKLEQTHVVDTQLELLRYLDIENPQVRFDVPRDTEAERSVDQFFKAAGLCEPFITINPGAGWGSKQWPADRFGEVAGRLWGKHGIRSLVVWAGGEERARAREIAAVAGDHAVVSPSTSLPQLAGVLRLTSMLVSADTGPAHLAAAVGTPVVGLFGPTLPEVTGPYGDQHIAIQAFHQSGRAVKRRRTPNTAMLAITVDQVCLACEQVLTRGDAKTCAA